MRVLNTYSYTQTFQRGDYRVIKENIWLCHTHTNGSTPTGHHLFLHCGTVWPVLSKLQVYLLTHNPTSFGGVHALTHTEDRWLCGSLAGHRFQWKIAGSSICFDPFSRDKRRCSLPLCEPLSTLPSPSSDVTLVIVRRHHNRQMRPLSVVCWCWSVWCVLWQLFDAWKVFGVCRPVWALFGIE